MALAGTGLLTTVGVIVAMDTFGPVSDNAQGIAEMSGDVDEEAARTLTDLDAVGNTTKAITKGIAIATAVLAATALFGSLADSFGRRSTAPPRPLTQANQPSYYDISSLGLVPSRNNLDVAVALGLVSVPSVLVGLLVGAAVVFLFSGLAIDAVTRAAGAIVFEVRRQFPREARDHGRHREAGVRPRRRHLHPRLAARAGHPRPARGARARRGRLRPRRLRPGGLPRRRHRHRLLMAVFLANAGGAWDNAKKLVEDGSHGGKGSEAHAATVIGDTVGDPFKDTAGPAINPLLKVMNLVAILGSRRS